MSERRTAVVTNYTMSSTRPVVRRAYVLLGAAFEGRTVVYETRHASRSHRVHALIANACKTGRFDDANVMLRTLVENALPSDTRTNARIIEECVDIQVLAEGAEVVMELVDVRKVALCFCDTVYVLPLRAEQWAS